MIGEPSGALVVRTGKRTGRSPKDRFIVEDDLTREAVDWGAVNKPFSSEAFGALLEKAARYVGNLEEVFIVDAHAGADERYRLDVQVVTEQAWQSLFARQLFRRPERADLESFEPDWTVISMPGLLMEPEEDGTESETFVGLDFSRRVVLVCGTTYAGEIKKSIFTVLNFVLPTAHDVMPMHCSANVGDSEAGNVALFFGLSGTGKTTLSADPERQLIGDGARLVRYWGLQLRGRLLRQDDRPLPREGAPDLERDPVRGRAGERGNGPPHPRRGLHGRLDHREHPRGLPA
jgi:phosphoenolpyruvate carboxykinase (ATP)